MKSLRRLTARSIVPLPVCCLIVMILIGSAARAYVLMAARWPAGSIVMHLQLGSSGTLMDGAGSWNKSAEWALSDWNAKVGSVEFRVVRRSQAEIANGNGINNVFWSDTVYGKSFGRALAITTNWFSGSTRTEADVVFTTAKDWNSYDGPLTAADSGETLQDFNRVALHEFGHVLGLGHPDKAGQTVKAIMNSRSSNLDHLARDDIAGARVMYGP